ncbi:hypothetical protein IFM89_010463 [Coptis chinensis]|uniref:Serpin domain-containing protein n=1 Tax=Coptis chinensis TaxID=261450 RepID=A0A835LZC1_9MAGN|nr:hypothetical protein IFM89_010463 [Coptis chinensis]
MTMRHLLRIGQSASRQILLPTCESKQTAVGSTWMKIKANMEPRRSMSTSTPLPCLRMAKELALGEAKDKNCVFSPCSIQLALSLLANGSTLEELLTFLEAENLNQVNSVSAALIDSATPDRGPILSFVGGVWVDQSLTLNPTFKSVAENIYKSKAETVDFQDKSQRFSTSRQIEINEEGTVASAATLVHGYGCAPPKPVPPVDFEADHPFIFMFRDDYGNGSSTTCDDEDDGEDGDDEDDNEDEDDDDNYEDDD